jgi:prephenate dehydrogenase
MLVKRLSILGVGLLGGSLGMAAKAAVSGCRVVGYSHRSSTLQRALEIGAIDEAADSPAEAADGADLVVLCTPVGVLGQMIEAIRPRLASSAVVTDVGSTKKSVVEVGDKLLNGRFVGSHPMAGSEKRGVEFARADLFRGAVCITTPTPTTDGGAVEAVEGFWRTLGMRLTRLDPTEHDRVLAEVSHLPHVVAGALVAMQSEEGLNLCGKGFVDTTRVAGGDGALWRDILLDNRDNLLAAIGKLKQNLGVVEAMVKAGDGDGLTRWLEQQAGRRDDLVRRKLKELEG